MCQQQQQQTTATKKRLDNNNLFIQIKVDENEVHLFIYTKLD